MQKKGEEVPHLSGKEMAILELLIARGEMYGLQMVEASDGRLGRGTVYVTLSRMEDKGYVESEEETPPRDRPGFPRRLYRASGYGMRVFKAWQLARALLTRTEVPA